MKQALGTALLGLVLALAGCAAGSPSAVAPAPPRAIRVPMVWVPKWGVHLVEGYDIVYYHDEYYFYYERRWYIARSPAGPWALVPSPPSALAALPPGAFHEHVPPGPAEEAEASPRR